jgi:hypothetical protein
MWALAAGILGVAALTATLSGGVVRAGQYLHRVALLPQAWALPLGVAVVAGQASGACLLLWRRTRRLGWVLVGLLGGTCAAFHAFALILGDTSPCPCLGLELISLAGLWSHAVVGVVCLGLVGMAFMGAGLLRRRVRPAPAGGRV